MPSKKQTRASRNKIFHNQMKEFPVGEAECWLGTAGTAPAEAACEQQPALGAGPKAGAPAPLLTAGVTRRGNPRGSPRL